jgi:hypothetical protein
LRLEKPRIRWISNHQENDHEDKWIPVQSVVNPGVYWFLSETMSEARMVEVRVTDGELTVWWPNKDQPIANLKGRCFGPIPPSTVAGSR